MLHVRLCVFNRALFKQLTRKQRCNIVRSAQHFSIRKGYFWKVKNYLYTVGDYWWSGTSPERAPLTGEQMRWSQNRGVGMNHVVAEWEMITLISSAIDQERGPSRCFIAQSACRCAEKMFTEEGTCCPQFPPSGRTKLRLNKFGLVAGKRINVTFQLNAAGEIILRTYYACRMFSKFIVLLQICSRGICIMVTYRKFVEQW